jgi:1-acyl-sn-glycerol-3-phosphate acyltransferase
MQKIRASLILAAFAIATVPLMPVQALFLRLSSPLARALPHRYHQFVCRLLGVRVHVMGRVSSDKPVLLVSNHVSWLDIPVLSSVAPLCFVAKSEVAGWPFISWLAKLQCTVFVDRTRRAQAGKVANQIADRLGQGDNIVLFAEGTSGDGHSVLPFKSSLFSAAEPRDGHGGKSYVQTLTIVYTRMHGLPMNRSQRYTVAWYGDMDMLSHIWRLLKGGPLDVHVRIGEPVLLESFGDRKKLAHHSEMQIRRHFAEILTARPR